MSSILDLTYNELTDVAANALAEVLKVNAALTFLNLNSNKITDPGAIGFANMLKVNAALTLLDLRHNKFGEASKSAIRTGWLVKRSSGSGLYVYMSGDFRELVSTLLAFGPVEDSE
jgi:cyanate lyase